MSPPLLLLPRLEPAAALSDALSCVCKAAGLKVAGAEMDGYRMLLPIGLKFPAG